MKWVKIGRYQFDLGGVILLADEAPNEPEQDGHAEPGVTVTLRTGVTFLLVGAEAEAFRSDFAAYLSGIRSPPRSATVIGSVPILSGDDRIQPGLVEGGVERRLFRINRISGDDQAEVAEPGLAGATPPHRAEPAPPGPAGGPKAG